MAAQWLVWALTVYGAAGLLFAAAFAVAGVGRVDPVAEHAPVGFRLIIVPGAAALWPLLLARWVRARKGWS